MNKVIYSLFASTLTLSLDVAHAASVAEVFNGDMLGTNQRYFESVAGIPRESNGDEHIFKVQGCDITATVEGGKVGKLRIELTPKCQADLTQFVGTYAPAPDNPLTVGAFIASSGGGLSYSAQLPKHVRECRRPLGLCPLERPSCRRFQRSAAGGGLGLGCRAQRSKPVGVADAQSRKRRLRDGDTLQL